MNLLTKGAIILMGLLLSLSCFAQTTLMRTDLISPSPTAANLAKYGDTPVTYYTGLPNVSIPIFNVSGNELSLPITLTYNNSGLQPTQQASWVGLGWSIQAGGVITRVLGDKIDGSNGYDRDDSAKYVNTSQDYKYKTYVLGQHDNLPDIYSFNFGNYSGKFIWFDNQAYLMPYQKLEITKYGGGFAIVTEDGIRYEFTAAENTHPNGSSGVPYNISQYASSWYLTQVVNSTATEHILLTYDDEGVISQPAMVNQSYARLMSGYGAAGKKVDVSPYPSPINAVFPTRVESKRLLSVASEKYVVYFIGGQTRADLSMFSGTCKALGNIFITAGDSIVKKFIFTYDYFGSNSFLKLTSLEEHGRSIGSSGMKHSFEYAHGAMGSGPQTLVDKYGYYKDGRIFNNTIISNEVCPTGVNRDPNPYAMMSGMLTSITYPTGGTTSFTYEGSRYFDEHEEEPFDIEHKQFGGDDYTNNHLIRDGEFTLTEDITAMVTVIREPDDPSHYVPNHNNEDEFEIRELLIDEFGNKTVSSTVLYHGALGVSDNNTKTFEVILEGGFSYIIRAICDDTESHVTAFIKFDVVTDRPKPGRLGPGLRLSELTHDNGFGKTITKRFKYVDEAGLSSGKLLRDNAYGATPMNSYYYTGWSVLPDWTNETMVHSSAISQSNEPGLPLYYRRVVEETFADAEVHRSVYEYDYFHGTKSTELMKKTDYIQRDTVFVPLAKTENTFSGEYYDEAFAGQNVYVSAQHFRDGSLFQTDYDSELKVYPVYWKHPVKTKQTQYEGSQTLITENKSYYDPEGTRNLVATKQINSDGSTLYTRYKYPEDYAGVSAISELKDANMLATVIEEQVWQKSPAGDSVLLSGRINEYSGKRIKAIHVLESAEGIASLNNEVVALGKYKKLLSDTVYYKKKVEFTYDDNGRVIKQQLTDHPPVSYLWGYPAENYSGAETGEKAYPIAEIKNAAVESVFYTSFEDTGTGTTMASVTGVKAKADTFKIKRTFTGTYTLTYWKKTGSGAWKLIEQTLTNPSNYVIGASGSYIDEVRLYPVNAQLTTYAYKPGIGMTEANDPNNKIVHYDYDVMGRLKTIKNNKSNITNAYQYHVKSRIAE